MIASSKRIKMIIALGVMAIARKGFRVGGALPER